MKPLYLDFPLEIKKDDVDEDGSFRGYGSTFGDPPDAYGDIVMPGAFRKTIKNQGRNGNGIAMLWMHKPDSPIGVWEKLREDKKGLFVEGQLAIDTLMGGDAHKLMKMGALKGLSIGYNAKKYNIDEENNIRQLTEVELWEISPVTFPANLGATILDVRAIQECKTPRELETFLREAGMSRDAAKYIVKLAKPNLLREAEDMQDEDWQKALQDLQSISARMEVQNYLHS